MNSLTSNIPAATNRAPRPANNPVLSSAPAKADKLHAEIGKNTLNLTLQEVEGLGWRVMAGAYQDSEEWMLDNCVADLLGLAWNGDPVDFRIVRTANLGAFILRRSSELKEAE